MKIAAVVVHFPALSETFILNQITGLIDRGHDVDIFATRASKQPTRHEDVDRYGLMKRTFYRPRVPRHAASRSLKALWLAARHGMQNPTAMRRALGRRSYDRWMKSWELIYEVAPFCGRSGHDVVHCHFGPNGLRGHVLRQLGAVRGKLVTTFYGDDIEAPRKLRGQRLYDPLFEACDLVLALSRVMQSKLIELGCDPNKIEIHPLGVDTARFAFTPRDAPLDGKVRVITIARHTEKKGLEYAIRAVARIAPKAPALRYCIVGDGPLRPNLEQLIDELNMRGTIELAGWRRHDDVVAKLRDAHLLVLPSVTAADGDQEGTPTALMEASAMGLPVLSTLHSGIPEVVVDGDSGYLVPERDVDALAQRLLCLIEHPDLWPAMGAAGRQHVERCFDVNVLNDRLVGRYERLLSGK